MIQVQTYNLTASNGKHIRKATQVIMPSGRVIKFMELLSKEEAINQANNLIIKEQMQQLNNLFK